jgi:ubiquinone/menaquinone biosynthesis C-methylase UbiE
MKTNEKSKGMGLYSLIGGKKNGELTSSKIEEVLRNNFLIKKDRERVIEWKKELEFWEEYSKIYFNLEKANPYSRLSKTIEELIDPKEGDVCLDVGIGPGKMSRMLWEKSRKQLKRVFGIDIVLTPAKESFKKINSDTPLTLLHANIGERLPFPDNYFNVIVANLCLSYVIDFEGKKGKNALEGALKEMYRVLKKGGHIVWSTPRHNVRFEIVFLASLPDMLNIYYYIKNKDLTRISQGWRILKHALEIQRKGKKGTYTFLPREDLENLIKKIGFVNLTWKKTFAGQVWVNKAHKPHKPFF